MLFGINTKNPTFIVIGKNSNPTMRKPWHVLNMSGYRDWSCLSPSCYTPSDNWHRNPNELRIKPAAKAAGERPVRSSVECRCCIFNEGLVWLLQCYNTTLLPLNIFADKKKLLKLLLIVESIITSFLNLACVDQTRWIASECRVRFIKQPKLTSFGSYSFDFHDIVQINHSLWWNTRIS